MKGTGIGIIKQTLPDGRIAVFTYDKNERKVMGETNFKKLLAIWQEGIISEYERSKMQESKK